MKRNRSGFHIKLLIAVLTLFFLAGCNNTGSDSSAGGSGGTGGTGTTPSTSAAVAAIEISTSSATIGTNQTATITVTLFNSSGEPVSEPAEIVFSLDSPTLGSIPSPVTTSSGFTNQVFTARNTQGSVTITATSGGESDSVTIQISNATAAADVAVAVNPASITLGGTAVVSATVTDTIGNPMPDGTTVNFSVDNPGIGTIVGTSTVSGGGGVAQSTFSAGTTTSGTATITATSGSASGTGTIIVNSPAAGSIEFSSATPQVVVIRGAGGVETSEVKFLVKDSNGDPVGGSLLVQMDLSGPGGGEYLGDTAGTTTLDVGTQSGYATVILHSGTIPGTATITATVGALSTSSGIIAIGGGVPSAEHFSLSAEKLNVEGLYYDDIADGIRALLADRYGNYNVLQGTAVSFYSECGAIDRATALDATGAGTVTFRTQTPAPLDVTPDPLGTPDGSGSCGVYCDQENAFISDFWSKLNYDISADPAGHNPRDGLCTVIAVVDGEEEFTDTNANGLYDLGEPFKDTYDDIHLDMDDDPYNVSPVDEGPGMPYDSAFEDLVVDRNSSGTFNGMNDLWDRNKRISKPIKILFTGFPGVSVSSSPFNVPNGESQTIYYAVHDANYNRPIGGTSVTVTINGAATLTGDTTWTYPDENTLGTKILAVTLTDKDPATLAPAPADLTFTVTYEGTQYRYSFPGTTN